MSTSSPIPPAVSFLNSTILNTTATLDDYDDVRLSSSVSNPSIIYHVVLPIVCFFGIRNGKRNFYYEFFIGILIWRPGHGIVPLHTLKNKVVASCVEQHEDQKKDGESPSHNGNDKNKFTENASGAMLKKSKMCPQMGKYTIFFVRKKSS